MIPKRSKPLPHTMVIIHFQTALSFTPSMDLYSPRASMISVSHRLCPLPLELHSRLYCRCMIPKTYKPLHHPMGPLTCKPHCHSPSVWICTAPWQRAAYLTHRLCTHQRNIRSAYAARVRSRKCTSHFTKPSMGITHVQTALSCSRCTDMYSQSDVHALNQPCALYTS